MNYTGPKVRRSRRIGVALTPKAARVMRRKPAPPGEPARGRGRRNLSNYGRQLLEKQRLRFYYNISERQMRNSFARAAVKRGNTGENLIQLLESRLDALLLRAGLAPTIYAARQAVSHGHVEVNGGKVKSPSYRMVPGDSLRVREKSRSLALFRQALSGTNAPSYLRVDPDALSATLAALPERGQVPVVSDLSLVIEFYSR
jgi:small subunit ribosomal protein S4